VQSTTTVVQTQTVISQTSYTVTSTATETQTQTSTTTEITGTTTYTQFDGLAFLSNQPGCTLSYGSTSYPVPCWGQVSNAVAFNCAAAASTPQGCTQQISIAGAPSQTMNMTVLYPYVNHSGEADWQNCKLTETLPSPPGPQTFIAYCISFNSTSFFAALLAPGPVG